MAKLSAHGREIGRIHYTTAVKAHMADGTILRNADGTWKLHAKVKEGVDLEAHFRRRLADHEQYLATHPELAAYRKALHDMTGLNNRWKLALAVQMMPDDPDGVWSEACDGYGNNVHADLSEIDELCRLYRAIPATTKSVNS